MKRIVGKFLSVSLLVIVSVVGSISFNSTAMGQAEESGSGVVDVVIINCETEFMIFPPFPGPPPPGTPVPPPFPVPGPPPVGEIIVRSSSSNLTAPNVSSGTPCAEALSALLTDGFEIQDVQQSFGAGAIYTLVRK